jgi:hypothetical protein
MTFSRSPKLDATVVGPAAGEPIHPLASLRGG